MFKTKIILLDKDWNYIWSYKSRMKPSVGDFIYVENPSTYYVVLAVVHSLKSGSRSITIMVDTHNSLKNLKKLEE